MNVSQNTHVTTGLVITHTVVMNVFVVQDGLIATVIPVTVVFKLIFSSICIENKHPYSYNMFLQLLFLNISDINECLNVNICNHGSCMNTDGSFHCDCFPGWSGPRCDQGKHISLNKKIKIYQWIPRFLDKRNNQWTLIMHLKIDIDECAISSPCCNGGSCVNQPGSFACNCGTGWTGSACEKGG